MILGRNIRRRFRVRDEVISLVNAGIESRVYVWCQASGAYVIAIQVRIILSLPVDRSLNALIHEIID